MNAKDIQELPKYNLPLSTVTVPVQISRAFGKIGIEHYLYAFVYKDEVMKYGSSNESRPSSVKSMMPGERVYRQAAHIPGWKNGCHASSSGADMSIIIKEFFPNATKDDVTLVVYDATSYDFSTKNNPKYDLEIGEFTLISEYRTKKGKKPVGNIKDMTYATKRVIVKDSLFNSLFEES